MKIIRSGAYRNAGSKEVINEDISKRKKKTWKDPKWNSEDATASFRCRADFSRSTYDYNITIDSTEIFRYLTLGADEVLDDELSCAQAKAAIALLTELLKPKPVED